MYICTKVARQQRYSGLVKKERETTRTREERQGKRGERERERLKQPPVTVAKRRRILENIFNP